MRGIKAEVFNEFENEGHLEEYWKLMMMKINLLRIFLIKGSQETDRLLYRKHITTLWCLNIAFLIEYFVFPDEAAVIEYFPRCGSQKWRKHFSGGDNRSSSLEGEGSSLLGTHTKRLYLTGTTRYWFLGERQNLYVQIQIQYRTRHLSLFWNHQVLAFFRALWL